MATNCARSKTKKTEKKPGRPRRHHYTRVDMKMACASHRHTENKASSLQKRKKVLQRRNRRITRRCRGSGLFDFERAAQRAAWPRSARLSRIPATEEHPGPQCGPQRGVRCAADSSAQSLLSARLQRKGKKRAEAFGRRIAHSESAATRGASKLAWDPRSLPQKRCVVGCSGS